MTPLHLQQCITLEQGLMQLSDTEQQELLQQLAGWALSANNDLQREFRFQDYYHTLAFVNAVAWISHQQDHHPEMVVGYNHCLVRYSTHAVNGLSINDFICAARVEQLQEVTE